MGMKMHDFKYRMERKKKLGDLGLDNMQKDTHRYIEERKNRQNQTYVYTLFSPTQMGHSMLEKIAKKYEMEIV